jgi:hypothetical protein
MKNKTFYLVSFLMVLGTSPLFAQLNVVIENGSIYIKESTFGPPDAKKYSRLADSLDRVLKENPKDTTSLFGRALILEQLNNQLAKATSYTKDPISNLTIAKDLVEQAIALKMRDFRLKVLLAQLYKDLAYRYSVSESWKFTSKQIAERKVKYNAYKELANKYYDELAVLDSGNAYDYQRLKVKKN